MNCGHKSKIDHVLNNLLATDEKYIFVDGHPVDTKRNKYRIWRQWFNSGKLKCVCCGTETASIKLVKCRGGLKGGAVHESGKIKHTFILYAKNSWPMTLDHWIPKWFLKKKTSLDWKIPGNLVLMCRKCNEVKADMVPFNWETQYVRMAERC
jgi:hypothetical protein